MTASDAAGCAALLAGLPGMSPRRLRTLLDTWDPTEAWARVLEGREQLLHPVTSADPATGRLAVDTWAPAARQADPAAAAAAHRAAGVAVRLRGDGGYPDALRGDPDPPAVLFTRGDPSCLDAPRAAIVGTRRCTGVGAGMARELGRELAAAGVAVVSGLALGIDGAAHRGLLDALASQTGAAAPVGVVGSGLDVVYPSRHRDLWHAVAAHGVLVSEAPLGARPEPWRFPARNRIIAALADVVVVVESHVAGGSLHTVEEAARRGIQVMAVPGSVRSPAAAGTNQLLAEGCHPVRDAGDVLVALGLTAASRRRPVEHRPTPDADGAQVLQAFDWEPATLEHLAVRTGLDIPRLAVAVAGLVACGWVSVEGGWYERVAAS